MLLSLRLQKLHIDSLVLRHWMVFLKTRSFVKQNNAKFTNVSSFTLLLICSTHFTLFFIFMDPCIEYDSVEITNKMQPCNRIYYSTVHWRLNMFRAAYCSSSGTLTVFAASGLHTHVVTGRSQTQNDNLRWQRSIYQHTHRKKKKNYRKWTSKKQLQTQN
jgi:hypothetical protein